MGQTGSEMKLEEAIEVKINRSSIFKPAEAGTGDRPLPCGTEDVDNWSKLVKIPFVGAYFCLAESRHCVTADPTLRHSQKLVHTQ